MNQKDILAVAYFGAVFIIIGVLLLLSLSAIIK
jgi:hypothetical protein